MTFAHPFALLWGLLAVAVVVLYRLRARPRREMVATGMFWQKVFAEERARSRWQPWRHKASLGLQLLLLLLTVVALAGPQVPRPRRTVLILDSSAGMGATDVQPTRLDTAKETAFRLVEALRDDDQMAVLSADAIPAVRAALTTDRKAARQAIENVVTNGGPAEIKAAVELARQMLSSSPAADNRIVILSDGCFKNAEELAATAGVELIRVGTRAANTAITRLAPRRSNADPRMCEVLVEVSGFSDTPVSGLVALSLEGKAIATETVRLDPRGRWQHVFDVAAPHGGRLTARIEPTDAYPADNEAEALIPPPVTHSVAFGGEGPAYLQDALKTIPQVKITGARDGPNAPTSSVVRVFDGPVPEKLPAGPVLVFHPEGPCDLWQLGEPVPDPMVARQADNSPVAVGARLVDVYLPGARQLKLSQDARAAAHPFVWTADDTPLGYAIERPQGRVVVLCGNLAASNLVGRSALSAMLVNLLDWLCGASVLPGQGDRRDATPAEGRWDGCTTSASDLRVPTDVGVDQTSILARRPAPAAWLYPAGLALVLFVTEWCLYQRRWTV